MAPKVMSAVIKMVMSVVCVLNVLELVASCWLLAHDTFLAAVWIMTVMVIWYMLAQLRTNWCLWLPMLPNEPYAALVHFIVTTSTIFYFVLSLSVTRKEVTTISFLDNYYIQVLVTSLLMLNFLMHGRSLEHVKYLFFFQVDVVQVVNNIVFFLLVEACILYLKEEESHSPDDLSSELLWWLLSLLVYNGVALLLAYPLHLFANNKHMATNPDEKDYTDVSFGKFAGLKSFVAFASVTTFAVMVGRIWYAWDIWTPTKKSVVIFYAVSFFILTVLLYAVQYFRVPILKLNQRVPFFGFRDRQKEEISDENPHDASLSSFKGYVFDFV